MAFISLYKTGPNIFSEQTAAVEVSSDFGFSLLAVAGAGISVGIDTGEELLARLLHLIAGGTGAVLSTDLGTGVLDKSVSALVQVSMGSLVSNYRMSN